VGFGPEDSPNPRAETARGTDSSSVRQRRALLTEVRSQDERRGQGILRHRGQRLYSSADFGRSLAITAVVGIALILINEGPGAFLGVGLVLGEESPTALDILTPFRVGTVSAVLAHRRRVGYPSLSSGEPPGP
jgi:hypothetical protein